jgi:hypothetical protein
MSNPLTNALQVLQGLQSATDGGISYQDYAPRVTDAKIQVDRMLSDTPDSAPKAAIVEALAFHVFASYAWNAKIFSHNYDGLALNPLSVRCTPLQEAIATRGLPNGGSISDTTRKGISIAFGFNELIICANNATMKAKQLLSGDPTPLASESRRTPEVGGPSAKEYEIYDAVESRLDSMAHHDMLGPNAARDAISFVAASRKLSEQQAESIFHKVKTYEAR